MNEQDWLSCTDPTPMLRFLEEGRVSERKGRLLACAACRQIWRLLPDPRSRQAVVVAERYADGQASAVELAQVRTHALKVASPAAQQAWPRSERPLRWRRPRRRRRRSWSSERCPGRVAGAWRPWCRHPLS